MADCGEAPYNPETPCVSVWGCGAFDYKRLRRGLQEQRHYLIAALNRYHELVKTKKVPWTTPVLLAYQLCDEESWNLLTNRWTAELADQTVWWERWTFPGYVKSWVDERTAYATAATEMASMANRCHAATCDVINALEALGETAPQKPVPPPPEKGWADQALDFSIKAAKTVGFLVLAGALGLGGYLLLTTMRAQGSRAEGT